MTEQDLKCFIDVVVNYFNGLTGEPAGMGMPFLQNSKHVILDYTGVIGISGSKKGAIYVTAPREMLEQLASIILQAPSVQEELIVDMAGEMANTIAGNVRETFGSHFMISVPVILKGAPKDVIIKLKPPVFIIPVKWRRYSAFLAVGIE